MSSVTVPATRHFTVMRGSTTPFITVRLKNPDGTALALNDLRLTIGTDTPLVKTLSGGGLVLDDALQGEYSWTPTPAETRSLPVGVKVAYELEVRIGTTQEVYMLGTILGAGGLNDD